MKLEEIKSLWDKHTLWLVRDGHNNDLGQATLNNARRGQLLRRWVDIADAEELYQVIAELGYCSSSVEEVRRFTNHLAQGEKQVKVDLLEFLKLGHTFAKTKGIALWQSHYERWSSLGATAIYVREDYVVLIQYGMRSTSHLFIELPSDWVAAITLVTSLVARVKSAELLEDGYTLHCQF